MALHPIKLPRDARHLRRIVAMQKLLLKALCANPMGAHLIDEQWLKGVWSFQSLAWVQKFCRKRKYSALDPIRAIANSPSVTRVALYSEFRRQNRVSSLFAKGGQFKELTALSGFTPALASEVRQLFIRFYQFLSHETKAKWNGYELPRGRTITNADYKAAFRSTNEKTMNVCPYCDGANDGPELDHYYSKSDFPLLACSPWNLIPACGLCNDVIGAKGNRLALTLGIAKPTADWLHPFFRPASTAAGIKLSGPPKASIPQLTSHDATEQTRLDNHTSLIQTLSTRWTNNASAYFDILVIRVRKKMSSAADIVRLVEDQLSDQIRGLEANAMVRAAVCEAVIDNRPEYRNEFLDSNPPRLV
jgi:hypothetical protein